VLPFGSAVTGFWTPHSDVDVCVQVPVQRSLLPKAENLGALKLVTAQLRKEPSTKLVHPIYSGKVPIVKWKSSYGDKDVAIDISINNTLAVRNSELLRAYSLSDERLRPLMLGIKLLAKTRRMNDRSTGTLSSFSLALMLISYFQQRRPALLPDLQAMARNAPSVRIEGKETRFCGPSDDLQLVKHGQIVNEAVKQINKGVKIPEISTGQLLKEFLRFYAYEYQSGVIRITKSDFDGANQSFFVENPFEAGKDVANLTKQGTEKVVNEFKRAYRMLSAGSSLIDVCRDIH
jgi:DNA polymerase sigma